MNGEWQFEIDRGNSGEERKIYADDITLKNVIVVPFCPQSELSGIEDKDFMSSVWYKRTFELTEDQLFGRVYAHFGAVDYLATVYVNGQKCGSHKGGYVSFRVDITDAVHAGMNTVTVHAEDDERNRLIPRGKQCEGYYSCGCDYTRTTGIWQTVWLEFVPETHIEKVKYYPSVSSQHAYAESEVKGAALFYGRGFL